MPAFTTSISSVDPLADNTSLTKLTDGKVEIDFEEKSEDLVAKERAKDIIELDQKLENAKVANEAQVAKILESAKGTANGASDDNTNKGGRKKKQTVAQLRESIKALEDKLGVTERSLSKLAKPELQKYLAELMVKAGEKIELDEMEKTISTPVKVIDTKTKLLKEVQDNANEIHEVMDKEVVTDSDLNKMWAKTMYTANVGLFNFLENVSKRFEDKIHTNLNGLSEKINQEEDKQTLIDIFTDIAKENQDVVKKYMTPMNRLAMYNVQAIGLTAAGNFKKK